MTFGCRVPVLLATIALLQVCSAELTSQLRKDVTEFLVNVSSCYNVPGVSLAVVDGDDSWATGVGWADKELRKPSTNATRYCIGSITKSFTTTLLAILLAKENHYTWDTPVAEILPDYRWNATFLVEHVTLRDLCAHRLGQPRYDLILLNSVYSSTEHIKQVMPYLTRTAQLRTKFMYNNNAFLVAGLVAEKLGGDTWFRLVRRHVTDPLGMDVQFTEQMESNWSVARNYVQRSGVVQPDATQPAIAQWLVGAAGAICMTSEDMVKYLRFHLDSNHTNVENGTAVNEIYKLHMTVEGRKPPGVPGPIQRPVFPVSFAFPNYGLGLFIGSYRDYPAIQHGGAIGYISLMTFLPKNGMGVFLSTNGPGVKQTQFMELVTMYIFDRLLGEQTWLDVTNTCEFPRPFQNITQEFGPPNYARNTTLVRDPKEYIGTYGHFGLGQLSVQYNSSASTLELNYGKLGRYTLWPLVNESDKFEMQYQGLLASFSEVDVPEQARNDTTRMKFVVQNEKVVKLNATFIDPEFAVFEKNLDPATRPTYPLPCVDPESSSGTFVLTGSMLLVLWMIVGNVCLI